VDQLTPWVKSQFNFTSDEIAADPDRNIEEILTGSPQALKYYDQGKQYYQEGKFEKSNESLEKALDIDPGFVLAYKKISENYHYLGDIDQAKKYAQMAFSWFDQDRVSFRERHLIEGWAFTILEGSYEKAIETYKKLLQNYPDDEDGNTYLGAIYRNMEEWDLAIERFEKVYKVNPQIAVDNFVFIYRGMGLYDKARKILQANKHFYEESYLRLHISVIYFCEGKIDLALREAEVALSLVSEDDNTEWIQSIGNIYHSKDNFLKAEESFRQLLEKNDPQSQLWGRLGLGHIYLSQGQYDKCRKEVISGMEDSRKSGLKSMEVEYRFFLASLNLQKKQYGEALNVLIQAEKITSESNLIQSRPLALTYLGLAYLKNEKLNEAKSTAEELKQCVEKTGIQKYIRYYHYLLGMIAQKKGLLSLAIKDFEEALLLFSHQQSMYDDHAFYLNGLASAYYQMRDLEKANDQYQKIISLTTGRLRWGDIYVKSFYWLGKISQEEGWGEEAIEHYEKFLQLWENADPDLPETADAKKQLDVLKNTSQE
jgi:tetratricopeptide (TPR) repeat protein